MALRLDFKNIREHRGSQNGGFEELCCQLAALEDPARGSSFLRKGPGPDQGLECYRTYADGHEVGWQAKYFINGFGEGQASDLNASLQRALKAHPRLTTFVVCLPINLSDNRSGKKASEAERYERWRARSIAAAAQAGRELDIQLWSDSTIVERLGRDSPAYSGRARYWFDAQTFSTTWLRDKLEVQRRNLGDRYSPESHVELPIQEALQSVARAPEWLTRPAAWAAEITYVLDGATGRLQLEGLSACAAQVRETCGLLLQALGASPVTLDAQVPLETWATLTASALDVIYEALKEVKDKVPEQSRGRVRQDLVDLYSEVDHVRKELANKRFWLTNKRELLITGPGGIGKSHLVADFGHKQLEAGRPFILILSGTLTDGDPWAQIRGQLDLARLSNDEFLGALDAAAEAAGCRAVLAIDALNERHGVALWRPRLQGFVGDVQRFPRLALVLTVRSTYLHYLPLAGLEQVAHRGFAGHAGAAAKAYLDRRGIARPSSPNLAREFENPLFLRTCCAYLDAQKLKQLPKGMDGVTAVFDFYLNAIAKKVEEELGLVPQLKIPRKALNRFLDACSASDDGGSLSLEDTIELLEGVHSSGHYADKSLFSAFLSEGVLSQDVEWQDDDTHQEIVRFTFERLSDHLRAERLIGQIDRADIEGSFRREPLAAYFDPFESWQYAGVIEALAVQLPEEFGVELFDVLPKEAIEDQSLCDAFESSLAWRAPKAFTGRTAGWIETLCKLSGRSTYGLMLLVSTEPENSFNAKWLHKHLWALPMPQRDATWSVFLAQDNLSEGGSVESLVDWALEADAKEVDEQRLWLAAVTLTWFLSTSSRAVRDRSTKALANLLTHRLGHAAALVDQFAEVDDPYISERLLAACYGAAMQGMDQADCKVLAASVWKNYFSDDRLPPLNVLARDYAWGILAYAKATGQLPTEVDLDACKAKFRSAWPLETVTEEDLKQYSGRGYGDAICSSTDQHGDFGHYTVRGWLHDIVTVPRALAGNTTEDLFEHWQRAFFDSATYPQQTSRLELMRLALDYRQRPRGDWLDGGTKESDDLWGEFCKAHEAFKALLSAEQLAEYTPFAEHHFLESTRMSRDTVRPRDVDHGPVRRWICDRAHKLGWTEALFDEFESSGHISHDRMGNHRVERIGKKYQYIALSEAVARLTDNLAVCSFDDEGMLREFEYGPHGRDMKDDLDPSLLVRSTKESGWAATPITWWNPSAPWLPSGNTDLLLEWVAVESDLCNDANQIEVVDPDDHRWLKVHGSRRWSVPGQNKRNHADAWSTITCLVAAKGTGEALAKELLAEHRGDATRLRDSGSLEVFLGEHGWRNARDIKLRRNTSAGITTRYAGIVDSFSAESNGKDNSVDATFSLYLPSSGAIKALGLHLRSGKVPEYVDVNGLVRWQDPSLHTRGAGAALASRDYFLEKLGSADLEPVWVLAGEKNVYGNMDLGASLGGFGGCLHHTTVFALDAGTLKALGTRTEFQPPTQEQLKSLKGG